jgi:hypothetical protein
MNLNFETTESLWSYFSKHLPPPAEIITGHEDPTHFPRKIEDREFISDAFEAAYSELESDLRQALSSVSTYHACRVIDESSYKKDGIRKLRINEITEWMKTFFGLQGEIDEAVIELEKKEPSYRNWNGSGVFTMCSISDSENRNLGYKAGSEFIRRIAKILGSDHLEKYKSAGRSCYIETKVPLDWFEENTDRNDLSNIVRNRISHWILTTTNNHDYAKERMNFAVIYNSDIPANMIHSFHYTPQEPTSRSSQLLSRSALQS